MDKKGTQRITRIGLESIDNKERTGMTRKGLVWQGKDWYDKERTGITRKRLVSQGKDSWIIRKGDDQLFQEKERITNDG